MFRAKYFLFKIISKYFFNINNSNYQETLRKKQLNFFFYVKHVFKIRLLKTNTKQYRNLLKEEF